MATLPLSVDENVRSFVACHATGNYQEYLLEHETALRQYRSGLFDASPDAPTFAVTDSNGLHACCQFTASEWDSQTLGVRAGRISMLAGDSIESKTRAVHRLVKYADSERHVLITARVDARDTSSVCALQQAGFRLADALAVYLWDSQAGHPTSKCPKPDGSIAIEPIDSVTDSQMDSLQQLALGAFEFSRISTDPELSAEQVAHFYGRFLRDVVAAEGGVRLVAQAGDSPVGFAVGTVDERMTQCVDGGLGYLSLIAVDSDFRGRGVGQRLLNEFLNTMGQQVRFVEIATQLQNHAALNLYAACGLRVASSLLTFHRWRR